MTLSGQAKPQNETVFLFMRTIALCVSLLAGGCNYVGFPRLVAVLQAGSISAHNLSQRVGLDGELSDMLSAGRDCVWVLLLYEDMSFILSDVDPNGVGIFAIDPALQSSYRAEWTNQPHKGECISYGVYIQRYYDKHRRPIDGDDAPAKARYILLAQQVPRAEKLIYVHYAAHFYGPIQTPDAKEVISLDSLEEGAFDMTRRVRKLSSSDDATALAILLQHE